LPNRGAALLTDPYNGCRRTRLYDATVYGQGAPPRRRRESTERIFALRFAYIAYNTPATDRSTIP